MKLVNLSLTFWFGHSFGCGFGTFGFVLRLAGKWPHKTTQCAKFKNWPKTHPKLMKAQNKHEFHHFGGKLALNCGLRHPKCFFW